MAAAVTKGAEQPPEKKQSFEDTWEYSLREYLLLLATVVATVTYGVGFSPPGGVWDNTDAAAHRLAGDPIIRDTSHTRYSAFFYFNATAFASSLVVIVLILLLAIRHDKKLAGIWHDKKLAGVQVTVLALRVVMVLDLLSLMGAFAAGTCRDKFTTIYSSLLVSAVFAYLVVQVLTSLQELEPKPDKEASASVSSTNIGEEEQMKKEEQIKKVQEQRLREVLMLLATFAVSVTYVAGLSTPGGFWGAGDRAGTAILKNRKDARLTAFFVCNTTAFAASLLIIVLLLDGKRTRWMMVRSSELYGCIVLALAGLVAAYAAGGCRETDTTFYVLALVAAVLIFIVLFNVALAKIFAPSPAPAPAPAAAPATTKHDRKNEQLDKARSLVLLLATLAVTITYQAGLDPPGGLWQDDDGGGLYKAGDPILLTKNPRRFKVFFYCNSVAFVASLVTAVLVQQDKMIEYHALEAAMVLDLFGLIGAYAAGSCRDVSTSIYAMALAGAVLVYVVIHVIFFTLDAGNEDGMAELQLLEEKKRKLLLEEKSRELQLLEERRELLLEEKSRELQLVEKRRERLLLFAILAATITYQSGLTPPGGFINSGEHAGDSVLLNNFQRRYNAFFYCNSVSFMLSVALIVLLVNHNLYRPAIRSWAMSVCTAAGLFGLMGAYAAGSTQYVKMSIYIFVLVAVVVFSVLLLLVVFLLKKRKEGDQTSAVAGTPSAADHDHTPSEQHNNGVNEHSEERASSLSMTDTPAADHNQLVLSTEQQEEEKEAKKKEEEKKKEAAKEEEAKEAKKEEATHAKHKYLMLLGILVASVTYQAGLRPPGGFWQSDDGGHRRAGNPVMHDNRRARYLVFFYSNSTSFEASIVVIILLLLPDKSVERLSKWGLRVMDTTVMNTTLVLGLIGLLVAYAAGSSRHWQTSLYVVALIAAVLTYVAIHVWLSKISQKRAAAAAGRRSIA